MKREDGVVVIDYDGYQIELDDLRRQPQFFLKHVSEKSWADDRVMEGLRVVVTALT